MRCATSINRGRPLLHSTPSFDDKIDLITAVDEYVFGYCLHERNSLKDHTSDDEMIDYIDDLLIENEYPGAVGNGRRDGHAPTVVPPSQPRT